MIELGLLNQDFKLYQNSHLDIIFEMQNIDDLTYFCIVWKMYKRGNQIALIEKKTLNENEISIDGNKFTVHIKPTDTELISPETYMHEARITNLDGTTSPVSSGFVNLVRSFTAPC